MINRKRKNDKACKKYYDKHREEILERGRMYYQLHKKEIRQKWKMNYFGEFRERAIAAKRKWKRKNKDRVLQYAEDRKSILRQKTLEQRAMKPEELLAIVGFYNN